MSRSGSHSHSSRSGSERLQTSGEAEEIILRVGSPAHGGHCVARLDDDPAGRVVFVRHALPGEVVRAVLTEKSAKIWRADAVEVLSASPDRVRSVWREAGPGGVGGGELGHVALSAQRTWKRWVLADCLRRIGGEEVAAAVAALPEAAGTGAVPVEAMPSEAAAEAGDDPRARRLAGTGTRTRIALTITDDGLAGMHGFRSGTVLPVTSLPLAVSTIRALGLTERALWRAHYRPGMRVHAVAPSSGDPVVRLSSGRWEQLLTPTGRVTGRRRVEEVVGASGLGLGEWRYSVHAEGFWQIPRCSGCSGRSDRARSLVQRADGSWHKGGRCSFGFSCFGGRARGRAVRRCGSVHVATGDADWNGAFAGGQGAGGARCPSEPSFPTRSSPFRWWGHP